MHTSKPPGIALRFALSWIVVFGIAPSALSQVRSAGTVLPLAELSRSVEELARRVSPAVVQVFSTGFRVNTTEEPSVMGLIDKTRSSGAGVLMDADGYLITNAHVVEGAAKVEVLLPELYDDAIPHHSVLRPRGKRINAEVVGVDTETDLAVLKVPPQRLPYLPLGD